MKSGRCINENVLEWAYKKRLIGLPPKKPLYQKEMEKSQPRVTSSITPSENACERHRTRRPDKQLYVPRARRSDVSSGDETTHPDDKLRLGSSPLSDKTTLENSEKKLPSTTENRKSVQQNPRKMPSEVLKRTFRNNPSKNLPDVVPIERNIRDKESRNANVNRNSLCERNAVQKSQSDNNSRVTCAQKSSISDCEPCDLVKVETDDKKPSDGSIVWKSSAGDNSQLNCSRRSSQSDCKPCDLMRIKTEDKKPMPSIRATVTNTQKVAHVPMCEKILQKASLSKKSNDVSHVLTPARKSSLSDSKETKLPLESKEALESTCISMSSVRTTSNISERKSVEKPMSSMKTRNKSVVEMIRKSSLKNQKTSKHPLEEVVIGNRESVDRIVSVESAVNKTEVLCERIRVQTAPASEELSDVCQNSSLNYDKNLDLMSEGQELNDCKSSVKHKLFGESDVQKSVSTENADITCDSLSNRKPHEFALEQVYFDAEESLDDAYLMHEVESDVSESKGDSGSIACCKSDDCHLMTLEWGSLSEIPIHVKAMEVNCDIGNEELCKSDTISAGIQSSIVYVENLQNTCYTGDTVCSIDAASVNTNTTELCDGATKILDACGKHTSNVLVVRNSLSSDSKAITSPDTSSKENVAQELQLIEMNMDVEDSSSSQPSENIKVPLEEEISEIVEKESSSSSVDVESNCLIQSPGQITVTPSAYNPAVSQTLSPKHNNFQIKPTVQDELEENRESSSEKVEVLRDCSKSACSAGQYLDEDFVLDQTKMDEDSWDSLFDENGDSLNPTVVSELTDTLGKVDIQKSKYDYLDFRPQDPDLSSEEFSHIVELYDFPAEFKTQDLMATLSTFRERGFNIKWIDDTHALAVFSSPIAATEALSIQHPLVKVRPLSQAISVSKWKAKRFSDDLLPYKPRPQTTASLARRLVSGALGLKVSISKEQRDQERQRLQQAKERKRQVAKQKQDVWDGAVK